MNVNVSLFVWSVWYLVLLVGGVSWTQTKVSVSWISLHSMNLTDMVKRSTWNIQSLWVCEASTKCFLKELCNNTFEHICHWIAIAHLKWHDSTKLPSLDLEDARPSDTGIIYPHKLPMWSNSNSVTVYPTCCLSIHLVLQTPSIPHRSVGIKI